MIRRMLLLSVALAIVGCAGDVGPTGPAGPQGPAGAVGPQGPTGASIAYQIFEGAITNTVMSTAAIPTGGVFPGIVCYVEDTTFDPGVWLQHTTDTFAGTDCAVIESGTTSFIGSALFPVSFVNSGFTVRIILFWLP